MQHGADDSISEVEEFCLRHHGQVRDGTVTLPSGNTVAGIWVDQNTILSSGKTSPWGAVDFDLNTDRYLKNYAILSYSFGGGIRLMGKFLGPDAVPFVAPSGRVWQVSAVGSWTASQVMLQLQAKRFGVFGDAVPDDVHNLFVSNPAAADGDLSSATLILNDASPDGRRRVYRADVNGAAYAWLEMTLSEVSATEVAASLAIVRTYAQTVGGFVAQAPVISPPPAGAYQESMAMVGASGGPNVTIYSPGPVVSLGTAPTGVYSNENFLQLSGHIMNLHYGSAGTLVETTADIEVRTTAQFLGWNSTATSSGSITVTNDPDAGTANATGSLSMEIEATLAFTVDVRSKVTIKRAGLIEASLENRMQGTENSTYRSSADVSGIGVHPSGQWPFMRTLVTEGTGSRDYNFSSGGQTVHDSVLSPGNTVVTDGPKVVPGASVLVQTSGPGFMPGGSVPNGNDYLGPESLLGALKIYFQDGDEIYMQAKRRTNTLFSISTGIIRKTGTTGEQGWDQALVGRSGLVDSTKYAESFGAAGGTVSWQLPAVCEQPATGEIIRGATPSQSVGFV